MLGVKVGRRLYDGSSIITERSLVGMGMMSRSSEAEEICHPATFSGRGARSSRTTSASATVASLPSLVHYAVVMGEP